MCREQALLTSADSCQMRINITDILKIQEKPGTWIFSSPKVLVLISNSNLKYCVSRMHPSIRKLRKQKQEEPGPVAQNVKQGFPSLSPGPAQAQQLVRPKQ